MGLSDTFTSTGAKFFHHQQVMQDLRAGRGRPVTCHVMLTDVCNHSCAFCSVQARAGDSLLFDEVTGFVDTLLRFGLKSVILSGGGNPILYKCRASGKNINDVVAALTDRGLEVGLITNGMPLRKFTSSWRHDLQTFTFRESWGTVRPETLDRLTWVRISMAGLDHAEREVYVPDVDPERTALGFSYVAHDVFQEPADPHHGKVSRPLDLVSGDKCRAPDEAFEGRVDKLVAAFKHYAKVYRPRYMRLLPNCLEPSRIELRCKQLECIAGEVNEAVGREVAFVQHKPPRAPGACLLGAIHPVLNCDGYVYPCDSCVLNEAAGHAFANPWRMCHWSEIGKLYENDLPRSLIDDPSKRCPGCVFHQTNAILLGVRDGTIDPVPPSEVPEHVNFV